MFNSPQVKFSKGDLLGETPAEIIKNTKIAETSPEAPVALAAESDFNPTNVPQAKRDELSKYVTENLGDIVDIKTKELKYDRRNAKGEVLGVETAIEYTVSFSNGTTLSTVPEEGRIEGLPAGLSAIKIGVGMWNLIEQSKAPTQQTSEVETFSRVEGKYTFEQKTIKGGIVNQIVKNNQNSSEIIKTITPDGSVQFFLIGSFEGVPGTMKGLAISQKEKDAVLNQLGVEAKKFLGISTTQQTKKKKFKRGSKSKGIIDNLGENCK